jgi:hypothetical protein
MGAPSLPLGKLFDEQDQGLTPTRYVSRLIRVSLLAPAIVDPVGDRRLLITSCQLDQDFIGIADID